MLKRISSDFSKRSKILLPKASILSNKNYFFCTFIEKFDPEKTTKLIIPIKVNEIFMPSNTGRMDKLYMKNETKLLDLLLKFKEEPEKLDNFAIFLEDKKKSKVSPYGVQCDFVLLENTGEVVISTRSQDQRVQLVYPENLKYQGEYAEVIDIKDKEEINKKIDSELAKNVISDLNKVIANCIEITGKQKGALAMMEKTFENDISSANIHFHLVQQIILDFILACGNYQFGNNSDGLTKLNNLIFKSINDLLKISKTSRKYTHFKEYEEFLKCEDPVLRIKLLIELTHSVGDYIVKELQMVEDYKKDHQQKNDKFYLRFAKKQVDKIAGGDNYEDYRKKFEELCINNELTNHAKRAIEVELELANGSLSKDELLGESDDRKKFGIVEEIFNFPWDKRDKVEYDILHAKKVFEQKLFGMEKVKDRIYEYIAKLKRARTDKKKGFVILITGPPGTGKTTVATLIGEALKRRTGIINLSGESDNITLKGSRRTYIDAQPSIFFKEIVKLGIKNPVLVLDEIDKLTSSHNNTSNSASSALLELLNPEENNNFIDQNLNIPLDFSETIFICTANYTMQILEPLLDRIEIIEIDDYTFLDKKEITEKFLIPETLNDFGYAQKPQENNIEDTQNNNNNKLQSIQFSEETISKLIRMQSTAGGVRGIKKIIEKMVRKANLFLSNNKNIQSLYIDELYLNKFLGSNQLEDSNFISLINNYNVEGSVLTADLKGYLVKLIIKNKHSVKEHLDEIISKVRSKKSITSKDILHKVNMISKIEKHVEEALNISINLVKYKLIDLFNEQIAKGSYPSEKVLIDLISEYNVYLTWPSQMKYGNGYGLAFYVALLSIVLKIKIPEKYSKILIIGEISPMGNILKVNGLRHFLSICEFYHIKNIMLPEGNKEEYYKYLEHSTNAFEHVFFIKTVEDTFKIIFEEVLQKDGGIFNVIDNNDNHPAKLNEDDGDNLPKTYL